MTPQEFYAELELLGLYRTGERTNLTEEWTLDAVEGSAFYIFLPDPNVIPVQDRREALTILKKTLGIGVIHGPH